METLDAMKAVYCYFFPEVRPLLHEVESKIPDDMWLVTTSAEQIERDLASLFDPLLKVPSTQEDYVNIDEIHTPLIERIIQAYSSHVKGIEDFSYSYPTSGSSEGLFHILTQLRTKGTKEIYVLKGEYEGYAAQATNIGMKVNEVDSDKTDIQDLEPGVWFISNPSARDGNIIPNDFIGKLSDLEHKIVLDLAYVGATKPYKFDASDEGVIASVISFSKPYGVFRFRMGFTFSREEIPSLYGNKWFKDTVRLFQALKIAEELGPAGLYERYRPIQEGIIEEINTNLGLNLRPSDSLLLAYLTKEDATHLDAQQRELIAPFQRGNGYRFCLTPYFERIERANL